MSMKYEVEQKFRLANPEHVDALLQRVRELGGSWTTTERHQDTYYAHPSRDFSRTDEALRIRTINDQHFVTYKGRRLNTETKTRPELELPLGPTASGTEKWDELWQALGFSPVGTVSKSRRKSTLTHAGWLVTVDLDDVDAIGSFVEIELITDAEQIPAAQAALQDIAAQLELTEVVRKSYLRMYLETQTPPSP